MVKRSIINKVSTLKYTAEQGLKYLTTHGSSCVYSLGSERYVLEEIMGNKNEKYPITDWYAIQY